MPSTLDKLMQHKSPLTGGLGFLKMVKPTKPLKPKLPVTEAKKAAKLLKDLGKSVTGIAMAPDGGFTVTAVDPGTIAANEPNEWD